jgi:hypothetical protein
MATTPDAESLTFDHCDIHLKVIYKGEAVIAHVSSVAMALASPVWKKFVFPPWKPENKAPKTRSNPITKKRKTADTNESEEQCMHNPSPVEELDFREDNGEALLILLRIAHLRFHENPITLPYETLLNLAILCNQYLCINLVKPWLPRWLEAEETPSRQLGRVNWLFIAWVFGREKSFNQWAKNLVQEVKTNDDGEFLTRSGNKISEPMPPGIIGKYLIYLEFRMS